MRAPAGRQAAGEVVCRCGHAQREHGPLGWCAAGSCLCSGWVPAPGGVAVEARAGARGEDSVAAGRSGASLPPGDAPGRRWRDLVADVLLFAALVMVVPVSLLLYVGVGQGAAVRAIAYALALMLVGWVIGRE